MGISIHQEYAKIGLETTNAKLDIATSKPQLTFEKENTSMTMESELPRVTIDQYPCRATSGMKNIRDFRQQALQQAVQNLNDFIDRRISEGNVLGAIQNKWASNAFAQNAAARLSTGHEFGVVMMPSEKPIIDSEGKLDINWKRTWEGSANGVQYQFTRGKIDINFTPGKVDMYLRQMNKLDITYQPDNQIDAAV